MELAATPGTTPPDCRGVRTAINGYCTINPDGVGGRPSLETYCDLTTDRGGWTIVDYRHTARWKDFSTRNRGSLTSRSPWCIMGLPL